MKISEIKNIYSNMTDNELLERIEKNVGHSELLQAEYGRRSIICPFCCLKTIDKVICDSCGKKLNKCDGVAKDNSKQYLLKSPSNSNFKSIYNDIPEEYDSPLEYIIVKLSNIVTNEKKYCSLIYGRDIKSSDQDTTIDPVLYASGYYINFDASRKVYLTHLREHLICMESDFKDQIRKYYFSQAKAMPQYNLELCAFLKQLDVNEPWEIKCHVYEKHLQSITDRSKQDIESTESGYFWSNVVIILITAVPAIFALYVSALWLFLIIPGFFIVISIVNGGNNACIEKCKEIHKTAVKDKDHLVQETEREVFDELIRPALSKLVATYIPVIQSLRNPGIDVIWIFVKQSSDILSRFNNIPIQIASKITFFEYDFIREICRRNDEGRIDEESLVNEIKKYVSLRTPLIEMNINEALHKSIQTNVRDYLKFVSSHASSLSSAGGISLRMIEEAIRQSMQISDSKMHINETFDLDDMSNMVIAAGAIGVGILSGGAGVALIASGPLGWLAGVVIGGMFLSGKKEEIKKVLRWFGMGLTSDKIAKHFETIEANVRMNVEQQLSTPCGRMKEEIVKIQDSIANMMVAAAVQSGARLELKTREDNHA